MSKKIHLVLQGKGGVGKSFISAMIAQYKSSQRADLLCLDTDPVNATFAGYSALSARVIEILNGDSIDSRKFDEMVELIASHDGDVVVDSGASTFIPLTSYIIEGDVAEIFEGLGFELVIHTVVTGGQAMMDTLNGFGQLLKQFPEPARFVVWVNPYWGEVVADGKPFEKMKVYEANRSRIDSLIYIPELKKETFGKDLSDMLQSKLTFDEAATNAETPIMTRQRLTIVRRKIYDQLAAAEVLG